MKILQYSDLEKMGDQWVYNLELPPFLYEMVDRGKTLEAVAEVVRYKASELFDTMYPRAVATPKEWLERMKEEQRLKINDEIELLERLEGLNDSYSSSVS